MGIEVRNITKKFGNYMALKNVNMKATEGELTALLGPSGSGKTTLLRIIAGLELPDSGNILFNGEDATGQTPRERNVGFVFQHYALFKHMTVFENVAFGLQVCPRKHRLPESKIRAKVDELLRLVQMEWMADRYPWQLSGGQRQRIALARALAVEPKVLLLDEPFGALDAKVRKELRRWIRRLHDEIHITSIFVTHDQDEALEVSDRVMILNEGRIEQTGTPEEVYDHPANLFVCRFLGSVNLFRGRFNEGRVRIGSNEYLMPEIEAPVDSPALAYARPFELEVERAPNEISNIKGTVSYVKAIGPIVKMELKLETGDLIEAELGKERYGALALKVGETIFVGLRNPRVFMEDGLI